MLIVSVHKKRQTVGGTEMVGYGVTITACNEPGTISVAKVYGHNLHAMYSLRLCAILVKQSGLRMVHPYAGTDPQDDNFVHPDSAEWYAAVNPQLAESSNV